jgi:hypothetical protein
MLQLPNGNTSRYKPNIFVVVLALFILLSVSAANAHRRHLTMVAPPLLITAAIDSVLGFGT